VKAAHTIKVGLEGYQKRWYDPEADELKYFGEEVLEEIRKLQ
jgi:hypothetical protein